ncbi:hypothetical protein APHNP_1014 [Anaplasma phagocytophilum str. ApNP]|uniref:Uncharacterized protein n=2 Tax=Anaplasma phagocytophilum TaxID=948 RepID=A0A0F3NG23_ANAPH|nr:hypothetical protein APHMUC_1214 [Anaplasma phagocytophilum str. ApMUC09]KJV66706.1 hypothetical protein APHNP_1014 [Anaplasma phagocytophilum str. ApNP]
MRVQDCSGAQYPALLGSLGACLMVPSVCGIPGHDWYLSFGCNLT